MNAGTKSGSGVAAPRLVRLFDCSSVEGIELGFRLVSALGDLRALLDRINELPQRRLASESIHHGPNRPDTSDDDEENKQCLPDGGGKSERILETTRAKSGDESRKQRDGSDPSLGAAEALKMIAQAEFEPILGDDDDILIKVRMNLRLLDIIRREGFRELRLWGIGDLTHCSLHSFVPEEAQSPSSSQEPQ